MKNTHDKISIVDRPGRMSTMFVPNIQQANN